MRPTAFTEVPDAPADARKRLRCLQCQRLDLRLASVLFGISAAAGRTLCDACAIYHSERLGGGAEAYNKNGQPDCQRVLRRAAGRIRLERGPGRYTRARQSPVSARRRDATRRGRTEIERPAVCAGCESSRKEPGFARARTLHAVEDCDCLAQLDARYEWTAQSGQDAWPADSQSDANSRAILCATRCATDYARTTGRHPDGAL
jgi:hypothetical protein